MHRTALFSALVQWLAVRSSRAAAPAQFLLRCARRSLRCLCRFIAFLRFRFTESARRGVSVAGSGGAVQGRRAPSECSQGVLGPTGRCSRLSRAASTKRNSSQLCADATAEAVEAAAALETVRAPCTPAAGVAAPAPALSPLRAPSRLPSRPSRHAMRGWRREVKTKRPVQLCPRAQASRWGPRERGA